VESLRSLVTQKVPKNYGNKSFIIALTRALISSLSRARWIYSLSLCCRVSDLVRCVFCEYYRRSGISLTEANSVNVSFGPFSLQWYQKELRFNNSINFLIDLVIFKLDRKVDFKGFWRRCTAHRIFWTSSPSFTWGRKEIQFPKRRVSTPKNTGRWKKSKNPVILWAAKV
jgi:hypothetical protein